VNFTGQLLLIRGASQVAGANLVQLISCPLQPTLDRALLASTAFLVSVVAMDVVEIIIAVRVGQRLAIVGQTMHVNPFALEANVVVQRLQL